MGYIFDDFWADIGTIRRFYEVNLALTSPDRPFDLNAPHRPIYTHARFLPPSESHGSELNQVLLGDGCQIYDSKVTNSVIGLRGIVGPDVVIESSVLMGADYYETDEEKQKNRKLGRPDVGIGAGSVIECAIIDKNARIGRNVHIRHIPDRPNKETENWVAQEGLVIIPKSAVIPDGTEI
jgi:glucose-1-phosphate adenylyltransferase